MKVFISFFPIPIPVKLFDAFNMRMKAQNYRKWKPSVTVKERFVCNMDRKNRLVIIFVIFRHQLAVHYGI